MDSKSSSPNAKGKR